MAVQMCLFCLGRFIGDTCTAHTKGIILKYLCSHVYILSKTGIMSRERIRGLIIQRLTKELPMFPVFAGFMQKLVQLTVRSGVGTLLLIHGIYLSH